MGDHQHIPQDTLSKYYYLKQLPRNTEQFSPTGGVNFLGCFGRVVCCSLSYTCRQESKLSAENNDRYSNKSTSIEVDYAGSRKFFGKSNDEGWTRSSSLIVTFPFPRLELRLITGEFSTGTMGSRRRKSCDTHSSQHHKHCYWYSTDQ